MRLSFDTIEELLEFAGKLKKPRTGKGGEADDAPNPGGQAPAPMQPPAGGFAGPGMGGAPAGFGTPGGGFPSGPVAGQQTMGPPPEVLALVSRIASRIDWAMQPPPAGGGQPAEQVLAWFRGQLGPEAAGYTMDQIKSVALPRAAVPTLEGIAKLMNA